MNQELDAFLHSAPPGAERILQALAAAESLTDAVAASIYTLSPIENVSAASFVRALHYTSFVQPRNSEWHFSGSVRAELRRRSDNAEPVLQAAHNILLEISLTGDVSKARTEIPSYLFTEGGQAYHQAAVGQTEVALTLYSTAAQHPLSGAQWLAGELAEEQSCAGIVPADSIEIIFLKAMLLFRQGRKREAEPLFERLIASNARSIEVRIAAHLLANYIVHRSPARAEELYRLSLEIAQELDDWVGLLMVEHSLGRFLSQIKQPPDLNEAERLLRDSLRLEEEQRGDPHGRAQTLHTLAALLTRFPDRAKEAEAAFDASITIGRRTNDFHHLKQVLSGLALFLSEQKGREAEAEASFREALQLEGEGGDLFFRAQLLNSLAILISKTDESRFAQAEKYFRESLAIGERIKNTRHISHALRALAQHLESRSPGDAYALLQRALLVNQNARDSGGEQLLNRIILTFLRRHPEL